MRAPYLVSREREIFKGTEVAKLRTVHNTSLAMVLEDSSFVDKMKALIKYAGAFKLLYRLRRSMHVSKECSVI